MRVLKIATNIRQINFSALMNVYQEGNARNGKNWYPRADATEQLLMAEQDFYQYLSQCFFSVEGAVYAMWVQGGEYVSALRLEPYQDGLLLCALETAPEHRGKGYACQLLLAVQNWLGQHGPIKIYSHVSRDNVGSQRTHASCGFARICDHAVYLDGSVIAGSDTYLFAVQ
jgi:RimJ/RimL family protein N-acetyltransferase